MELTVSDRLQVVRGNLRLVDENAVFGWLGDALDGRVGSQEELILERMDDVLVDDGSG